MSADPILLDQEARRAIEEDLHRTLLVEAAAGTGKTTGMVRRMAAMIARGAAGIEEIAAMTFTTRAAGQLRERFEDELRLQLRRASEPEEAARMRSALDNIDALSIGTIHGFCARLLREYPVEAGVDPGFTVIDGEDADSMRAGVWQRVLRALPEDRARELQELGVEAAQLESAFESLCTYPDVHFPPGGNDDLPAELPRRLAAAVANLLDTGDTNPVDEFQERLRSAALLLAGGDAPFADLSRALALLTPSLQGKLRIRSWADQERARSVRDVEYPRLHEEQIVPLQRRLLASRYPALLEFLGEAVEAYAVARRQAGILDNNDLLLITRDMLRDRPHLCRELQRKFRRILVDEFQDTDPIQAEIVVLLAAEDGDARDWRELRLRPGALFLVGDPKQSIYRFRRADIVIYNEVRRLVQESSGAVLQLTTSFRAVPSLCGWVNQTFGDEFPAKATDVQAADVPLQPIRIDAGELCGAYRFPISCGEARARAAVTANEAAAVAAWIRRAEARVRISPGGHEGDAVRPMRFDDVLVLYREHADLRACAAALEEAGIPYQIGIGRAERGAADVADFMNALRALIDPEDPVPIVGFLRGPLCGADDAALARYVEAGGVFAFNARAVSGADPRISAGLQYIKDSVRLVRSNPPAMVIADMIERLALLPWATTRAEGWMTAGAFQGLLTVARQRSARGETLAEIVLTLDRLLADGTLPVYQLRTREHAVRLMTLHGAKGLEAPVVVLAGAAGERTHEVSLAVDRGSGTPVGHLRLSVGNGPFHTIDVAAPVDWTERADAEQRFAAAEKVRLAYVAATRARAVCIVCLPDAAGQGRQPSWTLLAHRLTTDLPPLEEAPAEPPRPAVPGTSASEIGAQLDAAFTQAAAPGYRRVLPSRLPALGQVPGEPHEGRGAAFGSAMHALMEEVLTGDESDDTASDSAAAARIAASFGLSSDDTATLSSMLANARRHPLWTRISNATRRYTELPFGLPLSEGDDLPAVMEGSVDLLYLDAEGWTIVDFKTDATEDVLARAEHYAPQLRAYASAIRQITGEECRMLIWFLSAGEVAEVPLT